MPVDEESGVKGVSTLPLGRPDANPQASSSPTASVLETPASAHQLDIHSHLQIQSLNRSYEVGLIHTV